MRLGWRLVSAVVMCGAMMGPMAMARPKFPVPSTWRLDDLRSDFGGGPRDKSDEFTVTDDKPSMLSVSFVTVDEAGNTTKTSWNGPQNGRMLEVEGVPGTTFGIDSKGHEHWAFSDGSSLDGMLSMSKDKKTVLLRGVLTGKDGKTYQQILVYGLMD